MATPDQLHLEAGRKEELASELLRQVAWVHDEVVFGVVQRWAWEGRAADQVNDAVGMRMRTIEDGLEDLREVVWRLHRDATDLHEEARWLAARVPLA
ncbi:MAG: hypothetical protein ACRDZO_19090 [Egibacteraceae bacterium]